MHRNNSHEQSKEFSDLSLELLLEISSYLNCIDLFALCTTGYSNAIALDYNWKAQINQYFPGTGHEIIVANRANYRGLFSHLANAGYGKFSQLQKKMYVSIINDDLSNFHKLNASFTLGSAALTELIIYGLRRNIATGVFRELILYFNQKYGLELDQVSFLHYAASANSIKSVEMLLALGLTDRGAEESSPLFIAAQQGYLEIVKLLVANGADIEYSFKGGFTPLYVAAQKGHIDVVQCLHEKGANINHKCHEGSTPLYVAMQEGQLKIVDYLLTSGAIHERSHRMGFTPLYAGSRNGHTACVARLLHINPDLDGADYEGGTALYVAAQNGHHKVCELLLKAGANAECKYLSGYKPIYVAVQQGHDKVIEVLFRYRPDLLINEIAPNGSTAIYVAAQNGFDKCVNLLCAAGADVNAGYLDGYAPIYVAAQKGHHTVVDILLKYGANVNIPTRRLFTPLHVAIQYKQEKIIHLLLEHDADINLAARDGTIPLHKACANGNEKIIKLLLQYGSSPFVEDNIGLNAFHYVAKGELKSQFLVLNDSQLRQVMQCTPSRLASIMRQAVIELVSSSQSTPQINSLLLDTSSDFARMVILYCILSSDKWHPLAQDISHALGFPTCMSAEEDLHNALFNYVGNPALFSYFAKHVIGPLQSHIKQPDATQLDAALFVLAYFEGQVYLALPRKPRAVLPMIKNGDKPEETPEEKLPTSFEIFCQLIKIVYRYEKDHIAADLLGNKLEDIAKIDFANEDAKIQAMLQTLVFCYYKIRMVHGSQIYIGCSKFGDALEEWCKTIPGLSVPHFVPRGSDIPTIDIASGVVLPTARGDDAALKM